MTTGEVPKATGTLATKETKETKINKIIDIELWGFVDYENKILIEQINNKYYFFRIYNKNYDKKASKFVKGITNVQYGKIDGYDKTKNHFYIQIFDIVFVFKEKPKNAPYSKPQVSAVEKYINNEHMVRSSAEIYGYCKKYCELLYDFQHHNDSVLATLYILQTYVKNSLNGAFYYGIDSRKGSGKTVHLEHLSLLGRHGMLSNNISVSSIARMTQKWDISWCHDEIDESGFENTIRIK